jgi:hypothetical protein
MTTYVPIITEIGTLRGRDAVYLDSVAISDHQNTLTLCGEFNCSLASKPPRAKWQAYRVRFSGLLALQMIELDTWESLQEGRWTETSFDEVVDSSWLARMHGKASNKHRHFVFQTYDHVFEMICTSYELELKEARA